MHRTATRFLPGPLLLLLAAAPAGAVSPEAIPTPRPGGWAVDLTGTLRMEDLQALDRLGDEVKTQTGAELAVVVVDSTDGAPHRAFATDLANRWGIGDREKDNGVLVFAALDDRAAEIVLGEGIDDAAQVAIALEIMHEDMVPRFRAGDPAGAVVSGAFACARRILGAAPTIGGPPLAGGKSSSTTELHLPRGMAPVTGRTTFAPREAPRFVLSPSSGSSWPTVLALLGAGGGVTLLAAGRYYYRRRPRRCQKCQIEMLRLDEAEDDAHLSSGEQTEERVGSVDYDVWACPACGGVEKLRFGALFTSYATCPQCGARTVSSSSWTEEAATTWSEGRLRVDESCQHCDHRRSYTRSIPRRVERTSSSSSRSSSSSGFGGGRSSGGGASGRW